MRQYSPSLDAAKIQRLTRRLPAGETDLPYVAPGRRLAERFQRYLTGIPIALFAMHNLNTRTARIRQANSGCSQTRM